MEEQDQMEVENPSIKFNFDVSGEYEKFSLLDVLFEGFLAVNTPMSFYEDIIDFCKKRIEEIPHYEVSDGKLEWKEENHEG